MLMNIQLGSSAKIDVDTVYVHDFGDRYHKNDYEPSDKLLNEAMRIRRRYKTYPEYQYAISVYNDYVGRLIQKYGGVERFLMQLSAGEVQDYIPAIPRMKNNKLNRIIMKKKMVVSVIDTRKIDTDILSDVMEDYSDEQQGVPLLVTSAAKNVEEAEKFEKEMKLDGRYNSDVSKMRDVDILEDYFARRRRESAEKEEDVIENITMTQIIDGSYRDIIENTDGRDEYVNYQGQFIPRREIDVINNVKFMSENGWDSMKLMRSVKNDRLLRITKNQIKREKVHAKKTKKQDSFFMKIMGDNKYENFGDFENDMLNMSMNNFGR